MRVIIKKAKKENFKELQGLNHQLFLNESKFDTTINIRYPFGKQGKKYYQDKIKNDFVLIATIEDKIIGYFIGSISKMDSERTISKIAEAENMFVLKEHRGLGLGKKLMNEFTKWAKSKKADRIKTTASANNKRSIKFLHNQKFKDYELVLEKKL